eukprot:scpid111960/ scgid22108/ 
MNNYCAAALLHAARTAALLHAALLHCCTSTTALLHHTTPLLFCTIVTLHCCTELLYCTAAPGVPILAILDWSARLPFFNTLWCTQFSVLCTVVCGLGGYTVVFIIVDHCGRIGTFRIC